MFYLQSQRLWVSTVNDKARGLGSEVLFETYYVCLKETSSGTVIEYGKGRESADVDFDVYLGIIDTDNPPLVRFYSFGNGKDPLEIVDAHIVPRSQITASCKGDTVFNQQSEMCLQTCHYLCDPAQGLSKLSIMTVFCSYNNVFSRVAILLFLFFLQKS